MKLNKRAILVACLLLVTVFIVCGCSAEKTPYEVNDREGYNVSVKFDANGGLFTTSTSVIVDSYDISKLQTNGEGQAELALIAPDNENRNKDAYKAVNNGYFLAGWYAERIESKDSDGNTVYTYGSKWDFEKDLLKVDASKTYTSAEPVLTLYAAWVPVFEVELYDLSTGKYVDSMTFDPTVSSEIQVPQWNKKTGMVDMYAFPKVDGSTFNGAYYDEAGTQAVDTPVITHPGSVDYSNGTANNGKMKLYVDWLEGEWYHIYTAEQFVDNASVKGNYIIHADLDFAEEIWPTSLMYGNFTGSIVGNGHTFKNVQLTQTNNSKVNAGMFGNLTDTAKISDLTLDNVTFTIQAGTRVVGTSYGLLAGTISASATLTNLNITNSALQIDSRCYFGADDYAIGLVCGMGNSDAVDYSGITCVAVGDAPERVRITVNENQVSVEFVSES